MKLLTACPLDCYDACSVIYEDGKLKGDKDHPITQGYLCPNLNSYLDTPVIKSPRYKSKEISMEEALEILKSELQKREDKRSLYFRGRGNFGAMQEITSEFFARRGFVGTRGSLCDGAGEAGIKSGRGESLVLTPEEIAKSEVVVVWGRNIDVTNSHLMPFIKDKILIVIDPVKTKIAKMAHLHLQIKPRSDIYTALLMARFAYIEQMDDEEYIACRCEDFDFYLDFIRSYPVKTLLEICGVEDAIDVITALELMRDKRTVFLVGIGVQKYYNGDQVVHMIDSLAAMLGLHGKEGCGVSYLGNSSYGIDLPFMKPKESVPIATVDFGEFDFVFIQGSNPANQMPCSAKVVKGLNNSDFVVYYGLYENETSKLADLVIPSCNFLQKEDVRFSYGHHYIAHMPKLEESTSGISEYDLTAYLMEAFGYEGLKSEHEYIESLLEANSTKEGEYLTSKSYEDRIYEEEFLTDSGAFCLIDEFEEKDLEGGEFHLVTCKYKHSLNSQFKRYDKAHLPPGIGFSDGDRVKISSEYGSYEFEVKIDDRLRNDCVLIYSGVEGVNYLTPNKLSRVGDSAIYQEVMVNLEKI